MMKKPIFFLFAVAFSAVLKAQFVLSPAIENAQQSIMELRFTDAATFLKQEQAANPANGFLPYLKSNILFLKLFIAEDEKLFDKNLDSLQALIAAVENNKDQNSPYYKYCLAEMNFEIGALHMQFGNNWQSAWTMLDAFDYIKQNEIVADTFLPQQMTDGILNVIMGSLPTRYKSMARLLGYNGNVQKGLLQLKNATFTEGTEYESFKKKFSFAYCYTISALEEESKLNVWDVDPNYKDSPLLVYLQARIYRNRGENAALILLLEKGPAKNKHPFYYLDFMLGKAKLNRLDPDADASFLTFLQNYPGQNSLKAAHRYLSWHYYLRGSVKQSEYHKQKGLTVGAENNGADQQAIIDLNKPYNQALIKAQLYFDGGNLLKASTELSKNVASFKTETDRIEFHYRMGRIYQRQGEATQAIQSYKKVFIYESSANTYEAANAALQLGLIYLERKNAEEAKPFFEKVLGYEGFPYEDGIHQKAKAGLARLKVKS